jgi:hypothetical protein
MNQPGFFASLEIQLALGGVPFDRAELLAWVASMWPHIENDPYVTRWACEFVKTTRLEQLT